MRLLITLDPEADINVRTTDATTPLLYASFSRGPDILAMVKLLLEAGASPNMADSNGITPLHMVAYNSQRPTHHFEQYVEVAKALLDAGASVSKQCIQQRSSGVVKWMTPLQLNRYDSPMVRNDVAEEVGRLLLAAEARERHDETDLYDTCGSLQPGISFHDLSAVLCLLSESNDLKQARLVCRSWRRVSDATLASREHPLTTKTTNPVK